MSIIVQDSEIHRFDAIDIMAIHNMLTARQVLAFNAEIPAQCGYDRIKQRHARDIEFAASLLQLLAQLGIDQGEHDDAGIGGDTGEHALQLILRAHQRPQMFNRLDVAKLRHGAACHRDHRFTRGIGNQMKMKTAAAHC